MPRSARLGGETMTKRPPVDDNKSEDASPAMRRPQSAGGRQVPRQKPASPPMLRCPRTMPLFPDLFPEEANR